MKGTKTVKFIAVALALILSVGVLVGWTYVDVKGDIGINAVCGDDEVTVTSVDAQISFALKPEIEAQAEAEDQTEAEPDEPEAMPGIINLELKTVSGNRYLEVSDGQKEAIDSAIAKGYTATLEYKINANGYTSAEDKIDLSTLVEENGKSFKAINVEMTKAEYTLTFDKPEGIEKVLLNGEEATLNGNKLENITYFDTVKITCKAHYTCDNKEIKEIKNVTENMPVKIVPTFDWDYVITPVNENEDHEKGWYTSAKICITDLNDNYTASARLGDKGEEISITKDKPAVVTESGTWTITVKSKDGTQSWEKEIEIKNVDSTAPTYKFYDSENVFTANIKKSWGTGNYKIYKIEVTVDPTQISEKNLWKAEVWVRGDKKPLSEINLEKGDLTTSFNKNETDSVDKVFIRVFDKAGNTCDFSNSTKITFDPECFEEGFDGYTKELKVWIETDNNKKPKVTLNNGNRPENINVDQVKDENNKPVEGKYTFTATKNGTYVINDWLSYTIDCIDNHAPTVNDIAKPENAIKSINVTANDESTDTSAASGIEAVYLAKVTFGVDSNDIDEPIGETDAEGNPIMEKKTVYVGWVKDADGTELMRTINEDGTDRQFDKSDDAISAAKTMLKGSKPGVFSSSPTESGVKDANSDQYNIKIDGDGSYILVVWAEDNVGNVSDVQIVGENGEAIKIDNTAPVISNIGVNRNTGINAYYNTKTLAISATVGEDHPGKVVAKLMQRQGDEAELIKESTLNLGQNNIYTGTIKDYTDAENCYILIEAVDAAGNESSANTETFTVDTTDPTAEWKLTIKKGNEDVEAKRTCDKDGYFNLARTLTITVEELHFDIESSKFVYRDVEANKEYPVSFSEAKNGSVGNYDPATKQFTHTFDKDSKYQPVSLTLTDAAGNSTTYDFEHEKINNETNKDYIPQFTIDTVKPAVTVSYDNNNAQNGSFFNADRTATITITEHNFNDKVTVSYLDKMPENLTDSGVYINVKQTNKDGGRDNINPTYGKPNGDTYTLTIDYKNNVNYIFDVVVIDKAGNRNESLIAPNADKNFDVDKFIKAPEITGVANGSAYNDNVAGTINYSDANFQTATVRLMRADKNGVYDVTAQHTSALPSGGAGGNVNLVNFDRTPENDGIYTLTATITDKAGNTAESSLTFSVNRFGSTYKFSDYLTSICDKHIQEVTEDLKITEINPNSITDGTVTITRNGKPVDAKDVKAVLQRSGSASGGWYEYLYTISKDYFKEDGMYKIIVSSADEAGNKPNSENNEQFEIIFWVDDTLPEIFGIQGLEDDIINTEKQTVKFTIRDNIGLKTVSVYCDDKEIAKFGEKDFTAGDLVDAEFVINESSGRQHIRIVAEDLSGNVLNTDEKDDNGAFITNISFERDVTVSTNFFVRWFANKPLFFGSLAVIIAAGVGVYFIIAKKKNSKETSAA